MKILGYLDKSGYGNDCYINEAYSLCECFGIYFIIKVWKVSSGWAHDAQIDTITDPFDNINIVMKKWEELGGMPIEAVD